MRSLPVYECLIISPSDVGDERRAIVEEITRWNGTSGRTLGAIVAPVMWEHARPSQSASAQEVINEQIVDDCDFGIAVFWGRLGLPTASHESGSAEEIARLKEKGKEVLIYFKTASLPQPIDTEQYDRLQKYRSKLSGLVGAFDNADKLRAQVHASLTTLVSKLVSESPATTSPSMPTESTDPGLAKLERIPVADRDKAVVRWFAYKDHAGRDKFANVAVSVATIDISGHIVQLENKSGTGRQGAIRVPLSAIEEVWSDSAQHWTIKIRGRVDMNDLSYSP